MKNQLFQKIVKKADFWRSKKAPYALAALWGFLRFERPFPL